MSAGTEMLRHIAAKTGPFAHKNLIDAAEKLLRASDSSILEKLAAGELLTSPRPFSFSFRLASPLCTADQRYPVNIFAGDLVSIAALNQAFEPLGVPRPGVLVLHPVQATATSKLTGLLDKGLVYVR